MSGALAWREAGTRSAPRAGRALVLTPMVPPRGESDRNGIQRRVGIFLEALSRRFSQIEMLHIVPPDERFDDPAGLSAAQSEFWGVQVRTFLIERDDWRVARWEDHGLGLFDLGRQHPYRRFTGKAVVGSVARHLDRQPDFIFVDRIEGMLPLLQLRRTLPPVLFDFNDVEHKMWAQSWRGTPVTLNRLVRMSKLPALMRAERQAVLASGAAAVCSDLDREHLLGRGFGGGVVTVPNAVALPSSAPVIAPEQTVLFLGSCSYGPNAEAATRLVKRIWPLVLEALPAARLIIAGAHSTTLDCAQAGVSGVEFRGFVPSLASLYAESRVICCPLLTGGGTRLKLVEAAAFGRPMVSTAVGAEGLAFEDGHDILIRETDSEIASACVSLLRDEMSCLRLGSAARSKMARLYDVQAVVDRVEALIGKLCGVL